MIAHRFDSTCLYLTLPELYDFSGDNRLFKTGEGGDESYLESEKGEKKAVRPYIKLLREILELVGKATLDVPENMVAID